MTVDGPVSVLEIETPAYSLLEIFADPQAVIEVEAAGPQGPAGPTGPTGPQGATGPGIQFQGTWSPDTRYDANDFVSWQGAIYFTTGLAQVGVTPSDDGGLTVHSGWYLGARSGDTGATGPSGDSGTVESNPHVPCYVADLPAGTTVVLSHNLDTEDVMVQVRNKLTRQIVGLESEVTDSNTVTFRVGYLADNPTAGTYRALVMAVVPA